ncbi:MAG: hypothetical protein P8X86_16385, partial [Desulfofustis sp.]
MKNIQCCSPLILCALLLLSPLTVGADKSENGPQEQRVINEEKAAKQVEDAVAELSAEKKRVLATWLHLLDSAEDTEEGSSSVLT